jgi:hypothetical protein
VTLKFYVVAVHQLNISLVRLLYFIRHQFLNVIFVQRVSLSQCIQQRVTFLWFIHLFNINSLESHRRFNPTAYVHERNLKLRQIELQKYIVSLWWTKERKWDFFRQKETRRRLSSARCYSDSDSSGKLSHCLSIHSLHFILFYCQDVSVKFNGHDPRPVNSKKHPKWLSFRILLSIWISFQ